MVRVFGFWLQMGPKDEKYAAGCWANLISLVAPSASILDWVQEDTISPPLYFARHFILVHHILCFPDILHQRRCVKKEDVHVNILPPDVITEW